MAASCQLRTLLSRAVSRFRCSGGPRYTSTASLIVAEAVDHSACWVTVEDHKATRRNIPEEPGRRDGRRLLWAAVAFSLFSSKEEDKRDEAQRKEDEMILLLKKAKLSIHRGQLPAASSFLHQAVVLAHQTHNNQAIIYTYSQMANVAYVQGQLDGAEKLFKAAMSYMLAGGTPQDDNAIIEMSLKLATIYAEQNKAELAEHGFMFCTESLETKLETQKGLPEEDQTEEQEELRKETRLLLGLCLDSRARYRASTLHLSQAELDYRTALAICHQEQGETHPQTLVLMSDLATILDLQGRHDEALVLVQQAVDLSRSVGHPDYHVLLGNLAGILLHTGQLENAVRFYNEALELAWQAGDQEAVNRVQEGLKEVQKRRSQEKKAEPEGAAE
ncbi:tetratricopeptide repeat protein 19, mitochondrial [Austrofundulus limnaeus]|uniref:Tetratricopeptide repeat protein 19, mitochondrial n=1 Tax=Austrofundulus limnaeus TaxID=52670 RepID=A0A2I4D1X5_AUSLI|nr:PREDICTED: tetratricopeptide repeat protein 19, mitochondrial [Austrofundulus limnaeus]